MDFSIPDEYAELQRNITGFIDRELRPLDDELDPEQDDVPVELRDRVRKRSAELGFYAADFPEDLGGSGLPQLGMVLLREAAARSGRRLAGFTTYGPEGPTGLLLNATDEQKKKYLVPLISADKSMCFALTEPEAGSDAQSIRTTATRDGDSWVLNGTKHFITNGKHADFALVFAANDRAKKAQGGITAFLVEKGTPGFSVGRAQRGMVEGEGQFELVFEDCRVSEEQILGGAGNVGMGFYSAMQFLAMGRLSIAAMCNGIADYALSLGIQYAKDRTAFDRPIGKNQYVQGHIVDSAVELKASKLMTYERVEVRPRRRRDPGVIDGQAVRIRDGQPGRRPHDPGPRRHGLDARAAARAHLPAGEDLHPRRGDLGDPKVHHRQDPGPLESGSLATPASRADPAAPAPSGPR